MKATVLSHTHTSNNTPLVQREKPIVAFSINSENYKVAVFCLCTSLPGGDIISLGVCTRGCVLFPGLLISQGMLAPLMLGCTGEWF